MAGIYNNRKNEPGARPQAVVQKFPTRRGGITPFRPPTVRLIVRPRNLPRLRQHPKSAAGQTHPRSRRSNRRKQHGAAFRSRARVQIDDFKRIAGEGLVTFYESSPGGYRGFCRVCGSPIINKFDVRAADAANVPNMPSRYGVSLGTLDDDPGVRPTAHIFFRSKAPWFEIADALPQYAEWTPLT